MEEISTIKKNFIKYIDKLIENKRISHAYLIEIENYDIDFKYVFDFIKMILCDCSFHNLSNMDSKVISLIDSNNYPDIKIIEPDGNWIKKGQLLELQKEYNNKSLFGKKRIYIIKNADKLNSSSANTILKFLEEPEEDIIALLLTDNRYHVIDTILSRCQVLTLKEEDYRIDQDYLLDLLECVLNPKNFFIQYNFLFSGELADKNVFKHRIVNVESILVNYLNCKHFKGVNELNDDFYSLINKCNDDLLIKYISIIEEEIPKLEFNVNYKLWLDSLFSRLIVGSMY